MVNNNVKTVYFKALITVLGRAHRGCDLWLDGHECFYAQVFYIFENAIVTYAHLFVFLSQLLETPLGRHLCLLCVLRG